MAYTINEIIENPKLQEIARKAVEDVLVEFRDDRISQIRGNGLVIAERTGENSSIIRLGMEQAIVIALKAIQDSEPIDH